MKILCAKYNRERLQQFQTETIVFKNEKGIFVKKRPLSPAANTHVENIFLNYKLLKKHFGHLKLPFANFHNYEVTFEFISGQTFDSLLIDAVLKNDRELFFELLNRFNDLVNGLGVTNIRQYQSCKEFKEVFGEELRLKDVRCFNIANIDLIFDNILVKNNDYYVIDFEWVFQFPVPFDFVIFRSVNVFFQKYREYLHKFVLFDEVLKVFGLMEEKIKTWERLERKFQEYVFGKERPNFVHFKYHKQVRSLAQVLNDLQLQNTLLKQKSEEIKIRDEQIEELHEQLTQKTEEIKQLSNTVKSLENELNLKNSQIEMIYSTRTYRLANKIWKAKQFVLTTGAKYLPKPIKKVIKLFFKPYIQPENTANTSTCFLSSEKIEPGPNKYDVVCFPVIDWGMRFQRPQQLIRQFAQNGHRTFYFTTYFIPREKQKNNNAKLYLIKQIEENVYEVTLSSYSSLNLYKDKIDAQNLRIIKDSITQLSHDFNIGTAVCLVDLPFWNPIASVLKEERDWKIVYDCMDQHKGFSTNDDVMLSEEEALSRQANLVVVTAQKLLEEQKRNNSNCVLIPNAADFEHFSILKDNDLLKNINKPIIGYFGAISDWFDVDLLYFLAEQRPEYSFVLIGSTFGADVRRLEKLKNVYLLGEKHYDELPAYLYWFDVCTIPFKLNILTEATNPVKFFEYVSAGKPVVSVRLPELVPFSQYLYLAENKVDFLNKVDFALNEDPSLKGLRIKLAQQNTWNARFIRLTESINRLYPRVSIIIVTFNNLYLTKLCIDSIFAKSCYPNYELIIVDNLSNDGTREYLQDLSKEHENVRIILNDNNAGFAKANNQGIRIAEGDYIILLNNDTVVTHCWISNLLKYLRDPSVGMVGPVTNSCGNEAKINVDYKELQGMDRFAREYTTAHDGLFFEIKMLAMYCVAFRRSLIDEIGLLDERFGIGMFEDDDYSQRIKAKGYKIICAEDVFIHHFGGASFLKLSREEYMKIFEDNKKKYEQKWNEEWQPHKYRD